MFSGIGGFEYGIRQATGGKWECVGYSEIDKHAVSIYRNHFPDHINFGDATKINLSEIPDFDILVGGFPCQTFSIAGKRAGFADTRGTLFFEIARIAQHKRPRMLLLENVKGLLSADNGRVFATILASLDELGYDVEWANCDSQLFGVPQHRERIFIIGHSRREPSRKIFPITEDDNTFIAREGGTESEAKPASAITTREGGRKENNFIVQLNDPTHSNNRVYGADGVSPALNTAQGGNRQPKIMVEGNIYDSEHEAGNIYNVEGIAPTIKCNGTRPNAKNQSPKILTHYGHKNKGAEEHDISPTLKAQSHGHEPMVIDYRNHGIMPIAPTITGNDHNTVHYVVMPVLTPDRAEKRQNGRRMKEEGEAMFTLTAQDIHGVMLRGYEGFSIRRLMPVECEKLQAFPKDWTKYGIDAEGKKVPISDTQRFKCIGNAVTTNVISAIVRKIMITEKHSAQKTTVEATKVA